MQREDLVHILPGVTQVLFDDDENPEYGWVDDDMDDMIGGTFLVQEVLSEGVILKHPSGKKYSFHYSTITLVKSVPYFDTHIENVPVSCINKLELSFFERHCNYNDYAAIKKMLKAKRVLEFDKDTLNQIQQQYPRVIGAMLSNKKLKKVG